MVEKLKAEAGSQAAALEIMVGQHQAEVRLSHSLPNLCILESCCELVQLRRPVSDSFVSTLACRRRQRGREWEQQTLSSGRQGRCR